MSGQEQVNTVAANLRGRQVRRMSSRLYCPECLFLLNMTSLPHSFQEHLKAFCYYTIATSMRSMPSIVKWHLRNKDCALGLRKSLVRFPDSPKSTPPPPGNMLKMPKEGKVPENCQRGLVWSVTKLWACGLLAKQSQPQESGSKANGEVAFIPGWLDLGST